MKAGVFMKHFKIYSALLLSILLMASCGAKTASSGTAVRQKTDFRIVQSTEKVYHTYEEIFSLCQYAVKAQFVSYHEYDAYTELEFSVKDTVVGEILDDTIYVIETPSQSSVDTGEGFLSYTTGDYPYIAGEDYFLLLTKKRSVYMEHDQYTQLGDIIIPLDEPESSLMYGQPLINNMENPVEPSELYDYTVNCLQALPAAISETEEKVRFTLSDDLQEIADTAEYALIVKIGELNYASPYLPTENYRCTIQEMLSGDLTEEEQAQEILVTFFEGQVQPEKEYLIFATKADKESLVYTLAARENSCFDLDDLSTVEAALAELHMESRELRKITG